MTTVEPPVRLSWFNFFLFSDMKYVDTVPSAPEAIESGEKLERSLKKG
jgi:hypothetical protein